MMADDVGNPFRARLAAPGVPLGTWLMSGAPATAEALGFAGFDWLVLDMEHVPIGVPEAAAILRTIAGTRAAPVVRLPSNDAVTVKRMMDAGAWTLMFPFVETPDEARRAVASTRYPRPGAAIAGTRGFAAMHRASRFGTMPDYVRRADDLPFVIVQLETPEAVVRLEEIAAVPGIDALFLGPGDLSVAMGQAGNVAAPEVQAAIVDVARRCRAIGMPCGIVGPTPEMVGGFVRAGYGFVAVASDMGMMMRQAAGYLAALKADLA